MTEKEKSTDIEIGKKLVESQFNTDLNKVKYNEYFNAFIVSDIIPTKEYFEYRLDQTDKSIVALSDNVNEKLNVLRTDMDQRFEQVDKRFDVTDNSIVALRTDMDKRFDVMQSDMDKRFDVTDNSIVTLRTDMDRRFNVTDNSIVTLRTDMDKRFDVMQSDMDKRFDVTDNSIVTLRTDMDRRFEQVDRRFDATDKRFDKIDDKFDKLYHLLENRDVEMRGEIREQRKFTLKMFMISISISVLGVFGILLKTMGILGQ